MSTEATLRALNVHDRQTLWKNARAKDSDQARDLVARIEQLGLPYSEGGGLKSGDPLLQKIEQVVFSDDARTAGREATEAGRPALEPIDPMLLAALGMDYGSRNGTTREAGWFVAQDDAASRLRDLRATRQAAADLCREDSRNFHPE